MTRGPCMPIWHPLLYIAEIQYMYIRGCQIGVRGPQLCAKPRHFCKLDVATSRIAFLDLNLHVLQVAPSNSKNWGRSLVQNCTSDIPYCIYWGYSGLMAIYSRLVLHCTMGQKSEVCTKILSEVPIIWYTHTCCLANSDQLNSMF